MSIIDKQALREAAENATPGRIGDRVDGSIKYTCRGTDGALVLSTDNHDDYGFVGDNSLEDELFFRLCDPATVLALLDELESAEKLIDEQREIMRQAASDISYAILNLTGSDLSRLKPGVVETTDPTDTALIAERSLRAAAAGKGEAS